MDGCLEQQNVRSHTVSVQRVNSGRSGKGGCIPVTLLIPVLDAPLAHTSPQPKTCSANDELS